MNQKKINDEIEILKNNGKENNKYNSLFKKESKPKLLGLYRNNRLF